MKTPSDDFPLPAGWKKATSAAHGGKAYFINSETKETSWIDPRDKLWKKSTWAECGPDEVPYGWEIVIDPVLGKYYIDHIHKKNFLDDPRDTKPTQQIQEVKEHIAKTKDAISFKKNTLRLKKDEIAKIRQAVNSDTLPASLMNVEEEAKALEAEIHHNTESVKMMDTVVETLETETDDQLVRQQKVQSEIEDLKTKLAQQTEIRAEIQTQLTDLKKSYDAKPTDDSALKKMHEKAHQAVAPKINATSHAKPSADGTFGLALNHIKPMTRIEREMELLQLKRELEIETQETDRLKSIATEAKEEIAKALAMPSSERAGAKPAWVKLLNDYGKKSETIRINVKEKQAATVEAGGVMAFRDKLLFFTAAPLSK